jgi:hypothetical protein
MRILFALFAWLMLATFTPRRPHPPEPLPEVTFVHYAPVALDETDPGRTRLGPLLFLRGWRLTSNNWRFGGLSSLHVEDGEVLAFSDSGWRVRFPLPSDGADTVRGEVAPLPEGPGRWEAKRDRDIESMAVAGDSVWLGFERRNAIWRFDRATWRTTGHAEPPLMRLWPRNRGPEAMLRLPDGRFLVFEEGNGGGGDLLLFAGDPAVPGTPSAKLRYRPPPHYRATDAALLPDGRALVLNRRWTVLQGFTAKLTIVALDRLAPGTELAGREIADFRPPLVVDNLEGLSVTREGARTIVWITSDDNYLPLQRTLLLKFAIGR